MKKKKKKRVNKKKLISRILLLVIIIIAIVFMKNLIFTSNKDNNKEIEFSLIMDNEDISSKLNSDIYISQNGILYMSMEDIKNCFDKNIFYEESSHKIVTTSKTKVGAIDIDNNLIELNSAILSISAGIMNYNEEYFIPVSEISNIYNIEVKTSDKKAMIFSLYKSFSTANTVKKVSVKEEPGIFKKTIQKLDSGEEVVFLQEAEKNGWVKILTYEGNIGYVEKKKLSDINQIRTDMNDSNFTINQSNLQNSIEIGKAKLNYENLKDFSSRKTVVENIIKDIISKEKFTVKINLDGIDVDAKLVQRFIIELLPRLREIGGHIAITNNGILDSSFINENNLNDTILN